jgi:glucosyl-dolichyl phosphate glucuronosyltransferase
MTLAHGVSVAICTWNRAEQLDVTLEGLCEMHAPGDCAWEVLVVDNGSTDETRAVSGRYADLLPIRLVPAPRPGLGHARNVAVGAARFGAIAFLDDDVSVSREWLRSLWRALEAHPEAAFVGGTITAEFLAAPPRWLVRLFPYVQNYYAVQDRGPHSAGAITGGMLPYGANVCFRTALLRQTAFDVSIIYRESISLAAGDESAVLCTLLSQGHVGWWEPSAAVALLAGSSDVCSAPVRSWQMYGQLNREAC